MKWVQAVDKCGKVIFLNMELARVLIVVDQGQTHVIFGPEAAVEVRDTPDDLFGRASILAARTTPVQTSEERAAEEERVHQIVQHLK